eukprot:TRINITY_DN5181_c0_g1_i1.p1 TRINITY_DN5181_c0_g1~~TRINITY_DN5181_c0_g1_i1.p1  ORF type:complete len:780 (+),score=108.90 TRINITY_DN5181_c0_g1_i1:730-3069(+)
MLVVIIQTRASKNVLPPTLPIMRRGGSVLLVAKVHKRFDTTVQRADSEWTNVGYQDLAASPSHPPAVPNDSFAFSPTRLAERAASAGDLTGLGDARHRAASVPALKAPATISAHLTLIEASGPQVLRPGRYFCRTHERGLYISSANATDTESHRVLLWVDVTSVSADSMNITLRTTTKQVWKFTADVALLEKCHVDFAAHWSAAEAAHRFPLRLSCPGSFLIDAEAYFLALLDAMRRARSEIFIASWMLSPYIYLSRAQPYDHNTRLDNLLLSKALEGVHVYVLLYKEQLVPALNSFETKQYLTRLHPNIQVQRHQPRMYYSHHQKTVIIDQEVAFVGGIDLCFGRYDNPEHKLVDTSTRILGCDYWNPAARAYTNNDPPLLDLFDRYKFPRQPWHDIQAVVRGEAARDAALNFIQRWNHHVSTVASTQRRLPAPKDADPDPEAFPGFGNGVFQCQLLRSLCPTTGNGVSEDSIYQTLLREIQNARHYIYIENQFFISSLGNNGLVYNTIAEALLQRITRAIKCQETFRVFLVIQPCGEGDPRTDVSVRVVMQYQKATVLALYNAVAELCPDPSEYLSICCLRGHDYLPSKQEDTAKRLVTGYIYIHAKLAIIDDIKVIVGSANINDRSLKGTRDSEVAMLMEDEEIIQGYMNGEPTNIGKTVFEFRCNLWAEHLGISLAPLNPVFDPICEETFRGIWQSSAELNTKAYTICFPFIPQNSIRTLEAFNKYAVHCSASENPLLRFVRGHLCQYPTHFLCGADLSPAVLEKENLIDRRCFL